MIKLSTTNGRSQKSHLPLLPYHSPIIIFRQHSSSKVQSLASIHLPSITHTKFHHYKIIIVELSPACYNTINDHIIIHVL